MADAGADELRLWVDADALPGEIKEVILRASLRLRLPTVFVANKNVDVGVGRWVSFVRVAKGSDVADFYIVEQSEPSDLCVTADIPLAAALVGKGLTVIDPRGDLYSEATVAERLSIRDFMAGLREVGVQTGGPPPFHPKAKQQFAARLDSLLTKAMRERPS
jgi:uncharacterized protein YaiI (UPF0178 family)